MIVKNNYNECITNLACSIRKYFELDYQHNTLEYIDEILNDKKPKNVVTILFDGMGSNIMDRVLESDSFLIKNRLKKITTVFPATTVAATTSILTGLNPVETGMLGWNMYYKDIDKTITTFFSVEKGDIKQTYLKEAQEFKDKNMITKTIFDSINEIGKYKGYGLFPFGKNPYRDMDDMTNKIKSLCSLEGEKYIYVYDEQPDGLMHEYGPDSKKVKDAIKYRNDLVEKLSKNLKDTIIFVIADHGHIAVDNIRLEENKELFDCLSKDTSLEPRAVNFFIKEDKKDLFVKLFNEKFSKDFDLITKEEVINSKLFGDGIENKIFKDSLGDYLAIAKTNKALLASSDEILKSHHAGYTDDEIYVPLIVIDCTNS